MNVLIAYYSASGKTQVKALELQNYLKECGHLADAYEIIPCVPYTVGDLNWQNPESRSSIEMNDAAIRPEIAGALPDITNYDIIYIGFPVWWYQAPRIINSFLEGTNLHVGSKEMILFATSGGSGIRSCLTALEKTYPAAKFTDAKLVNRGIEMLF